MGHHGGRDKNKRAQQPQRRLTITSTQFKWALVVLAIAGLVGGALGSWLMPRLARPGAITATRVRLVDAEGQARATLAVTADGSPALWLTDDEGQSRVTLAVTADGSPALWLRDATGKARTTMTVLDDGSPHLILSDTAGKPFWSAP